MNSVPDPFSLPCSIISFTNILKRWQQKNLRQLWVRGVQRTEITNIAAGMYLWYFLPPKALPSFKGKYFRVPATFESCMPISPKRRKYSRNVRVSSASRKIGSILELPNNCLPVPWSQGKTRSVKGDRFCNAQTARDIFQVFGVSIPVVCLLSVPYPWGYSFQKLIIFLEDVRRPQKTYDFCCVSLRKYGCYSFTSEKMFYYTIKSTIIYYDQYKSTACVLAHAKLTRPWNALHLKLRCP